VKVKSWFETDKKGLEKIARRRPLTFVLFEPVQNALDTGAKRIDVHLRPIALRSYAELVVIDDDPDGFKDLSHAYTMFAESEKKGDPQKRGCFNLGEKLVLSVCEEARIASTKGTIAFTKEGRTQHRASRKEGTEFWGSIRMTRAELDEVQQAANLLLIPPDVVLTFNGSRLPSREPLHSFETTLPTLTADEEGYLKPTRRKTMVRVYEPLTKTLSTGAEYPVGKSYLYEMGIPVVEIDLPWSVEVAQKVPVNADRDNVTPAYKKELAVLVVNEMHEQLEAEDAASPIITETLADERLTKEAQERVLNLQFGEKRALFDPTDIEAGNRLVSQGYVVVSGNSLPKGAAKLLRENGVLHTTHEISPTINPYSNDPNAPPRKLLPPSEWTAGMNNIAKYAKELARELLGVPLIVSIDKGRVSDHWGACYGATRRGPAGVRVAELTYNLATLGRDYFEHGPSEAVNSILIHEFAHEYESNHLSEKFFKSMQKLGAKLVQLALTDPEFFKAYGWRSE
jgi:hypothetical protein